MKKKTLSAAISVASNIPIERPGDYLPEPWQSPIIEKLPDNVLVDPLDFGVAIPVPEVAAKKTLLIPFYKV